MKKTLAILFAFLHVGMLLSQSIPKRDSLNKLLRSATTADTSKAKIYNTFARAFVPNSPDSIIFYGKKGVESVVSDKKWKSNLINTVGVGFFNKSEYDSALHYYLTALKLREEINNEKLISSSYNNIAVIYQIKGESKKAMEYYFKNLKFREKINDQKGIANACDNIANLFNEQQDGRLALSYQFRSMKINSSLGDTMAVAQVYLNMGNSYDILEKQDSVYYYLSSSIPVLIKSNFLDGLAQAYNGLGVYYSKKGNAQLALNYFKKSEEAYAKRGDPANAAFELVNVGVAKMNLNDYQGGLKDCENALPIVMETNYLEKLKYCYKCLYRGYKTLKRDSEALKYHEKLTELKDSLINRERTKELTRIQLQHEYDTKSEIAELQYKAGMEIKEQEKKNQTIVIYFIAFVLIAAVFLIFFIINRLKLTREQNKIIELQKKDVEEQKEIVLEKQKEIIDSINYAKRIQTTLLAHSDFLNENIPQNFVLFRPKDIVSGDFYWATENENKFFLAACDSTGHGVPGAFMSLLNIGFLSEAINEKSILEPNKIFDFVRDRLIGTISKEGQQDGFDGILLCIDKKSNVLSYAAAHNAPIIVRNSEIIELDADKMPVGKGVAHAAFKLYTISVEPNDVLYLYTDGFADQFGGPKGKKFLYKKMNQLLASLYSLPLTEQKQKLEKAFEDWKGSLEQVDDVLVIGIKI